MPSTKIVCTLGPSTDGVLAALVRAGMSVARVNFSHGTHEDHARRIAAVRAHDGVAIVGDLQGPKWRIGEAAIDLSAGDEVVLGAGGIPLPHPDLIADVEIGQRLLLDDGNIELRVEGKRAGALVCRTVAGGPLTSRKGVSAPESRLSIACPTEKDLRDAEFAAECGLDYLALSFVRSAADIERLRARVDVPIVAKIEKRQALDAFDEILAAADAVMVARGDLGVETPAEEVPIRQKEIILACNRAGKPVITATQMLQSMVASPRPTRAEASDVANAILDGTDAVMLSAETATGAYPVESVATAARIAVNAEAHLESRVGELRAVDDTGAIAEATVEMAAELGARAIVTATMSGHTARMVARYRPRVPILAVTPSEAVRRRLALVWGVRPWAAASIDGTDEMIRAAERAVLDAGLAVAGDRIVLTAGIPFGGAGKTNFLKVHVVGTGA